MNLIATHDFENASDFMASLRRSHAMWRGRNESETGWIFRGQGDARWSLLPLAFRSDKIAALSDSYRGRIHRENSTTDWAQWLSNRVSMLPAHDPRLLADAAIDALAHLEMVRDFVLLADDAKHRVPIHPLIRNAGDQRRAEFGCYFIGDIPEDAAEMFAVAQHHGIPTRFLDWTYNPIVAAYFAAESSIPAADHRIAVWALRKEVFDFGWNLQRLTVRAGVTSFLDAQEGLFVWDAGAYLHYAQWGCYQPLESVLEQFSGVAGASTVAQPLLLRLTLRSSDVPHLLEMLWRERITPAHLMPTFDNVTRALMLRARW